MSPPSNEEVKDAIFSIYPDSAPGPDGLSAIFYQYCWDIIDKEVHQAAISFFSLEEIPDSFLQNFICMIPKKDKPHRLEEFRPISLCNLSYKIFSKIITTRLASLLPHLISEE